MSLDNINATERLFATIAEEMLGINHHEAVLPHSNALSKTYNAIYFRGSISVELPFDHIVVKKDYHANPRQIRYFEVIITEYHQVFVRWSHENFSTFTSPKINDVLHEFVNTGNHDSCWRSSGFTKMVDNFFEMCDIVNQKAKQIHKRCRHTAPIKMDTQIEFGGFINSKPIQFAKVKIARKNNDTYFLDLKDIKIVPIKAHFTRIKK